MHRDRREARLEGADRLDRRRLKLPRPVEPFTRCSTGIWSRSKIYARLPADWRVFLEHKLYEPAFYSTVIADWGSSLMAAEALGPKAFCLVDLGHHAPNVNIEQIVARLVRAGKLAGFHFNDSKYGDDDLDAGSIDPFRLFRVFNELVDAAERKAEGFDPAYMLDQSHNVTDPIESLMASAIEIQRAYAQALSSTARRLRPRRSEATRSAPTGSSRRASSPTSRRSWRRPGGARAGRSTRSPPTAPLAIARARPRSGRRSRGRRRALSDGISPGRVQRSRRPTPDASPIARPHRGRSE